MKSKMLAILAAVILNSEVQAEDKTVLAKTADAITPATRAVGDYISKSMMQNLAENDTPLGKAARQQLKRERELNRGPQRTMQECIKPNSLIDEDVQECMRGMREKSW